MTIEDIKKLIAGDETRTLELKKTTGELKDAMHSACAFLNTEGGWLIFGIVPKSLKIIGQQVSDATRQEIANALVGLEPVVDVRVEYIEVPDSAGNQVIAMHFDGWVWGMRPYTYHGCPYYKPERITKVMPREMYDDRLRTSFPHKYAWEVQASYGVEVGDLSAERIEEVVRLGVKAGRLNATAVGASVDTLMGKLNLKAEDGISLSNAAVVLFAKDTHNYPQLMIRMARFEGVNKNVFRDNQRVCGNLFDLLDAGMAFAFKHLNIRGKVIGLQREDKLEIPEEALREGLINALCHRTYDSSSGTVSLAIYDDRVEIENPGRLPNALSVESMKEPHDSFPTNLNIANVLFKTKYLDSWGSGVQRMVDACKNNGQREPEYQLRPGSVVVVFYRNHDTQNDTQNDTQGMTERQTQILKYVLGNNALSTAELARLLGVSVITIKRELKTLGFHWEGAAKAGHWVKKFGS